MCRINFKQYILKRSNLVESFLSLSILNGVNIILPLITLPYLVRVVGLSNYGSYSIVYTILQYVLLISAYGFAYTTTRQIAQNRENINNISKIVYSTLFARIIIALPAIVLGAFLVVLLYPQTYLWMYLGGLGIIIGDILNPIWLFQGYEKMRYMTLANLICKLFFTILIFLFIRSEDDYIYITILNSIGFLISGILSLLIARKSFNLKFTRITINDIIFQIKQGWSIFVSTLFMNLYRNSNIIILAFFVSDYAVGVYSTAEKVVKAVQSITSPVSNALFPHLSSSFKGREIKDCSKQILSLNKKIGLFFLAITIIFIIMAGFINSIFFDSADAQITSLMRWMSPVILFGSMNYVLGVAGLVNMNFNGYFLKAVSISGISSLILLILTVKYFDAGSGAVAMLCAEIVLYFMCLSKLIKLSNEHYRL